ncbi:MAG: molybdopterin-synthase adenylyltransferase MoeB [Deltaproteobacteria bacterium]|nr:molybdopterin-synthase adenylyltransferase MoeB [Deltaproteobacteria bacterium]
MDYTDSQLERYSRHILLKDVGIEGQIKISNAKVLVIGAGGLGSPALLYLAAAGVGTIGIADGDVVDLSNLQRQVIHFTEDVDKPKVLSAKEKINNLNPDVNVITYQKMLTADNILGIIKEYDFILDGTDNFPAKFLVNDACIFAKKPFSHGGILRFYGQTITIDPWKSACYRCLFIEPPPLDAVPSCSQAGVIGVMAGVLGTIQANEAIKFILEKGDLLTNRLLTFDALASKFREVSLERNPECPICGENRVINELMDYEQAACKIG